MTRMAGTIRRRRYQCCECLNDIMEYPAFVMDGGHSLRCDDCQKKDEECCSGCGLERNLHTSDCPIFTED